MRETGKIVIPLIKEIYSEFCPKNDDLSKSINFFVNKRTNSDQCLLRPYLLRLGYEISGKVDWINIRHACAAIEIFNISTYQSNLSFDEKYKIFNNIQKTNQFISSMFSLDIVIFSILKLKDSFSSKVLLEIINRLHQTNNDVYNGQFYDLNVLNINNESIYSIPEKDYLDLYFYRCEKLGGSLTSLCLELGGLLAGGDRELIDKLKKIGKIFGTAGQIVNDISDYIFPLGEGESVNGYQSKLDDFKKGKVTYPIFHLVNHIPLKKRDRIIEAQKNTTFDGNLIRDIERDLIYYDCITSIKKIATFYLKKLKKEIKKIPKSKYRDYLSLSFSSLVTNKYFAQFRELGELYNEPKN